MQSIMNRKIKFRESFRPFAPSVLEERASEWFDLDATSPYMLLVADVREPHRTAPPATNDDRSPDLRKWVNEVRSTVPAITHVDYSARVQTVNRDQSPEFHAIISAFEELTGCPIVINTSFNVRGEPVVCTPDDAYRCFMRTGIDQLVLERFLLDKSEQPAWVEDTSWQEDYVLD
jgi:carbamoyltransferase